MDLFQFTLHELRELLSQVQVELSLRTHEELVRARKQIFAIAQQAGISLSELVNGCNPRNNGESKRGPKLGMKVAVRYRHPHNAALAWTGRGRQPRWIRQWLAEGGTLAQLHVRAFHASPSN